MEYIESNYGDIEADMNSRNSTSKRKYSLNSTVDSNGSDDLAVVSSEGGKTRKKREELSVSACKCIKKETVKIVVKFN
jgi:hypothetical protein